MGEASIAIGATARAGITGVSRDVPRVWAALAAASLVGLAGRYLGGAWILLADFLAAALAYGALYRAAFDRPAGLAGLRWGREEALLAGVQLLSLAVFLVVIAVLLTVVGAVALGVAKAAGPQDFDATSSQAWHAALSTPLAAFASSLAPLASLAILVWLAARLSLAPVATIDAGRLQVLSAFDLTKGRAGLLTALGLGLYLPSLLIAAGGRVVFEGPEALVVQAAAIGLYYFCAAPAWTAACVHVYRHGPSLAVAEGLKA